VCWASADAYGETDSASWLSHVSRSYPHSHLCLGERNIWHWWLPRITVCFCLWMWPVGDYHWGTIVWGDWKDFLVREYLQFSMKTVIWVDFVTLCRTIGISFFPLETIDVHLCYWWFLLVVPVKGLYIFFPSGRMKSLQFATSYPIFLTQNISFCCPLFVPCQFPFSQVWTLFRRWPCERLRWSTLMIFIRRFIELCTQFGRWCWGIGNWRKSQLRHVYGWWGADCA
jgi:hypothetical protein